MQEKLVEYLDGRARPAERRIVEEHLSTCAECRVRAEEFRLLWNVLDDLPALSPSASFDASLRARIAMEPARHNFWNWLPSPRLAFAVTALVTVSVWMSSMPQVAPNPEAPRQVAQASADADFGMIRDLPVLEDYDVISKFDALSELPAASASATVQGTKQNR
jgi:anti-sigma factor RsiW